MKKKLKSKLKKNLKILVPYLGALFVIAGIIGLLFIQKPLNSSQDPRSDASEGLVAYNCGASCSSNADCSINLRCYQGECRLAKNPSSPNCKEEVTTEKTETKQTPKAKTLPKKGDDLIGSKDLEFKQQKDALVDKKEYDDSYNPDETLLDLFLNLIKNPQSKLPIFIILTGVMLIIITIFVEVSTRMKSSKNKPLTQHTQNKNPRKINLKTYPVKANSHHTSHKAKELLKTLENQPKG